MKLKEKTLYKITTGLWTSITIVRKIEDGIYYFQDFENTPATHMGTLFVTHWTRRKDEIYNLTIEVIGTKETHPEYFL